MPESVGKWRIWKMTGWKVTDSWLLGWQAQEYQFDAFPAKSHQQVVGIPQQQPLWRHSLLPFYDAQPMQTTNTNRELDNHFSAMDISRTYFENNNPQQNFCKRTIIFSGFYCLLLLIVFLQRLFFFFEKIFSLSQKEPLGLKVTSHF